MTSHSAAVVTAGRLEIALASGLTVQDLQETGDWQEPFEDLAENVLSGLEPIQVITLL